MRIAQLDAQIKRYKTYRGFINSDHTQRLINYYAQAWHPELANKGWGICALSVST